MTKPDRRASNGRDAVAGSSRSGCVVVVVGVVVGVVASDLQRAKPAIAKGWIQDSAPPATITSASPSATMRAASPSACRPVVHAVVVA